MDAPAPCIAAATLRIDRDAIIANYRTIAGQVAPSRVAAVVKADGYGLGAGVVGRALAAAGCRDFFVAQLGEAEAVKPALPDDARIYVLNGLQPGAEAACLKLGAVPVLNSLDQIARWSAAARGAGRSLPAVVQLDSGMARLGLPPSEVATLRARAGAAGRRGSVAGDEPSRLRRRARRGRQRRRSWRRSTRSPPPFPACRARSTIRAAASSIGRISSSFGRGSPSMAARRRTAGPTRCARSSR